VRNHGTSSTSPPIGPRPDHQVGTNGANNGVWFAIYTVAAGIAAMAAVLITMAVEATGLQTAGAAGGTFLSVLGITMTAHLFIKGR
jgi:hypothetical protein